MNKLFGNLGLGATCTAQLEFSTPSGAPPPTIKIKNKKNHDALETVPLFTNKDTVCGTVKVSPVPGKRVEHQGIRVQLVGEIEMAAEKGRPHEFLSLVRDLAPPGELHAQQTFPFEFKAVEMQHESYRGSQVRLRYALRVTIVRGLGQSVVKDYPFWVQNPTEDAEVPPVGEPIKMEVGIEDCLHIEFEYGRGAYHLTDTVVGKIYFLLVRIKLKHMELEIKRRETVGGGSSARAESETVAKYEIMDGAPARGEVIPIRLHLSPYELTPSYPNVHNKFGVKYSLNLVLVDDEDRRYFKQQEITLYRQPAGAVGAAGAGGGGAGGSGSSGSILGGLGGSGSGEQNGKQALTPRTAVRALAAGGGEEERGATLGVGEEMQSAAKKSGDGGEGAGGEEASSPL